MAWAVESALLEQNVVRLKVFCSYLCVCVCGEDHKTVPLRKIVYLPTVRVCAALKREKVQEMRRGDASGSADGVS